MRENSAGELILKRVKDIPVTQKLLERDPDRNFLYTALKTLLDPTEIRQFYEEYVKICSEILGLSKEEAYKVVRSNIGYCKGYYDEEIWKRWGNAIPEAPHPIFGETPPSEGDAFIAGFNLGVASGHGTDSSMRHPKDKSSD